MSLPEFAQRIYNRLANVGYTVRLDCAEIAAEADDKIAALKSQLVEAQKDALRLQKALDDLTARPVEVPQAHTQSPSVDRGEPAFDERDDELSLDWRTSDNSLLTIAIMPSGSAMFAWHMESGHGHGRFKIDAEAFEVLKKAAHEYEPIHAAAIDALRKSEAAEQPSDRGSGDLTDAALEAVRRPSGETER